MSCVNLLLYSRGPWSNTGRYKSYYSLCLNRRHSAYSLAGLAVRTAIIMGLHLSVPNDLVPDPAAREHRIRVWWTAFVFDRMWAIKLGYPVAIQDDSIDLELPSGALEHSDFADPIYSVAMIGLARISGNTIHSIYGRRIQEKPLSQTVHDSFQALRQWHKDLPPQLQMDSTRDEVGGQRIEPLHLLFNQVTLHTSK